jgi:hypothetical protein
MDVATQGHKVKLDPGLLITNTRRKTFTAVEKELAWHAVRMDGAEASHRAFNV